MYGWVIKIFLQFVQCVYTTVGKEKSLRVKRYGSSKRHSLRMDQVVNNDVQHPCYFLQNDKRTHLNPPRQNRSPSVEPLTFIALSSFFIRDDGSTPSVVNVYLTHGLSSHKPRNRKEIKSFYFFIMSTQFKHSLIGFIQFSFISQYAFVKNVIMYFD